MTTPCPSTSLVELLPCWKMSWLLHAQLLIWMTSWPKVAFHKLWPGLLRDMEETFCGAQRESTSRNSRCRAPPAQRDPMLDVTAHVQQSCCIIVIVDSKNIQNMSEFTVSVSDSVQQKKHRKHKSNNIKVTCQNRSNLTVLNKTAQHLSAVMRPPWISVAAEQGTRLQPAMPSFAGMCFQSVEMVPMNQWISSIGLIWIHNLTQKSRIVVSRASETPCCDCAQKFNSYKGHRIICWTSRWNLESYERQDMSNDDSESSSTPGYDTFKSCFEQKVLHTQNSRFK